MRQSGNTMIGFLIMIALVAVLIVASLGVFEQEVLDTNIEQSGVQVKILHQATTRYYDMHCNDAMFVQPTPAMLVTARILPNTGIVNIPGAGVPVIAISNAGTTSVLFRYSLNFPNSGLAERAASTASNATFTGNTATWRFSNHALADDALSDSYEYLNAFGANVC